MVKTVMSSNYKGLSDWVIQRLTALIMAVYTLGMMAFFIAHRGFDYIAWRSLFNSEFVKVGTILFLTSILLHTWVGLWTVITDYMKAPALRFVLQSLVFILLLALFFWGLQILWGL